MDRNLPRLHVFPSEAIVLVSFSQHCISTLLLFWYHIGLHVSVEHFVYKMSEQKSKYVPSISAELMEWDGGAVLMERDMLTFCSDTLYA